MIITCSGSPTQTFRCIIMEVLIYMMLTKIYSVMSFRGLVLFLAFPQVPLYMIITYSNLNI